MCQHTRTGCNAPRQAIKNESVERPHGVPVKESKKSMGRKISSHGQEGFSILRLRVELKPGFAGQFHFGVQPQKTVLFHFLHPPKIKCLTRPDFVGMTSTPPQPYAAHGFIQPAAQSPGPIHVEPAALTTDAWIRSKNILWRKIKEELARFNEHALLNREFIRLDVACHSDQCIRPARFDMIALDATQRQMHSRLEIDWLDLWK